MTHWMRWWTIAVQRAMSDASRNWTSSSGPLNAVSTIATWYLKWYRDMSRLYWITMYWKWTKCSKRILQPNPTSSNALKKISSWLETVQVWLVYVEGGGCARVCSAFNQLGNIYQNWSRTLTSPAYLKSLFLTRRIKFTVLQVLDADQFWSQSWWLQVRHAVQTI